MRDEGAVTLNFTAIDGVGGERTDVFSPVLAEGTSAPYYLIRLESFDASHFFTMTGISTTYAFDPRIKVCLRCAGGPRTREVEIALNSHEAASTFGILCNLNHDDCGPVCDEIALSVDESSIDVSHSPTLGGGFDISYVPGTAAVKVNGTTSNIIKRTTDIPSVVFTLEFTGSGSLGEPIETTVRLDIVSEGTHTCGGTSEVRYSTRANVLDVENVFYPTGCPTYVPACTAYGE